MYKVNKEKCIGCGACEASCPEGIKIGADGKAEIIDAEKCKKCGVKDFCPYQAIEETEDGKDN
jgi:ferredoxin